MATILSTSKDAPTFSFLGHSHGWQMTSSSGLKVHGQKGLRSKTRPDEKIYFAMKTPGRCQHLEHDFFVWKKVKSIKIRICWYRNITPPKKHHPKKKSPFFGFFPKIPLLNLNNPQPTNERYDNTKKKKTTRRNRRRLSSSSSLFKGTCTKAKPWLRPAFILSCQLSAFRQGGSLRTVGFPGPSPPSERWMFLVQKICAFKDVG